MILLLLALLSAPQAVVPILAAESGVSAENLADTPVTDAINMEASQITNQLSLTLAVTPGTSLILDVSCYESQDGTNWDQISVCSSGACAPDVRRYTFSAYAGAVKYLPTRWSITKKWVQCSTDDPADGTGTILITGARSWR